MDINELIINKLNNIEKAIKELKAEPAANCGNIQDATNKNIDVLGRITIPKSIRRKYQIEDGATAKVYDDNNGKIIIEILK